MSAVQAIFEQHIKPILEKDIRPDIVEIHPVVQLTIMVQKLGCTMLTLRNATIKDESFNSQKCEIFIHDTLVASGTGVVVRMARKEAALLAMKVLTANPSYLERVLHLPKRRQTNGVDKNLS
ncbi:hypothetical protein K493DRAFT_362385 [Basidiobolus meristosporus CBS 931.73]|uniref:DRBM domain-containing protein n=1 Tax=Basidiobolus meristosporus CBS 931.73 TaxID=1314790 RepID=A0A1Y1X2U9_9FUNG|nr:hypothetical protein K493DRAFT_362385 [Basidiobolus meristosporus CBS 931.73]|eukprot:ORX80121.1 hypothetical protein K493DRAFT_362385 [Basidiobolus meristosporus CBS 931.73]